MLWWLSVAPLGKPVVPDVYWMLIGSSAESSSRHPGQSPGVGRGPGQGVPAGRPDDGHLAQLGAAGPHLGDHGGVVRRLERGRRHQVRDAGLVQHELELVGAIGRVDGDEDGADRRRGELQQHPLGTVGRPDPDPVARLGAPCEQRAGESVDGAGQLGVGPAPARRDVDERLVARHPGGRASQVGADRVAQQRRGRGARRVRGECAPGADRSPFLAAAFAAAAMGVTSPRHGAGRHVRRIRAPPPPGATYCGERRLRPARPRRRSGPVNFPRTSARRAWSSRWVQARRRLVQPETRPDARHVGRPVRLVLQAELGHDALAVLGGEEQRDRLDFGEEVEVGGQGGDGAVEEHHVLHEQHQLLGHAGAEPEEGLDGALHLGRQLVGRQGDRVERRPVQAEQVDHVLHVDVVGEGAQVAQRGHLRGDVPVRRPDEQREQGQALGLGQAPRDAEVQQGDLPRRAARRGCRRAGHRGRSRGSWHPRGNRSCRPARPPRCRCRRRACRRRPRS